MTAPIGIYVRVSRRTDSVPCPKCGAPAGEHCKTPSGVVRVDYPHKARQKAHLKVWGQS